jgi:hypothetical protein
VPVFLVLKSGSKIYGRSSAAMPRSGVAHLKMNEWLRCADFAGMGETRFHGERSTVGHCIARIECEIHENLRELRGIGHDEWRLGQHQIELHVVAKHRPDFLDGLSENLVGLDGLARQLGRTPVSEDIGRDSFPAVDRSGDGIDLSQRLGIRSGGAAHDVDDRLNAHQHVVEFMRHLRGKPAEAGEAMELRDFLLHAPAVRNVAEIDDQAVDLVVLQQILSDDLQQARRTIAMLHAGFDGTERITTLQFPERFRKTLPIVGMNAAEADCAQQLFG